MAIDKKKLALIHIVKKELRLNDQQYHDILKQSVGVESARELDEEKFRKLMNYFVRSQHYRINPFGLTIKQKLFIQYLARDIGWSGNHLDNFIGKYFHKSELDNLTRRQAIKVIEALKNIQQRKT